MLNWIEFKIECKENDIDEIVAILVSNGIESLVIDDPREFCFVMESERYEIRAEDELVNKSKCGQGSISFYLEDNKLAMGLIDEVNLKLKTIGNYEIKAQNIKEEDWANNWKKYYKRFNVSKNIVINPAWEEYESLRDELVINLDPGMAFGNGSHTTTKLAVMLIEKYVEGATSIIDVGSGSGILSIIAKKLGIHDVFSVDIEEKAVESTNKNCKINDIDDIERIHGNLLEMTNKKADIVVANIVANVLLVLNKDIHNHVNEGGIYILSGIYYERLDEVKESLKEFEILEIVEMGEWRAIACRR
jgi:ribosomal protein L11 methyltransferase